MAEIGYRNAPDVAYNTKAEHCRGGAPFRFGETERKMKIAIFGGSFDPVHAEHVNLVRSAAEKLETDKIIVVPAFVPPHKQGKNMAPAQDRLNMAKLAFAGVKGCEVSAYELNAGGTSYTCLTLDYFRGKYPAAQFYLLVGADMLKDFYTWREPERILEQCDLVACRREGEELNVRAEQLRFFAKFRKRFQLLEYTGRNVSSTKARVLCAFGEDVKPYLPADVIEYIEARELYRVEHVKAALRLMTPARRKHSVRVALMGTAVAAKYKLSEHDVIQACGLHDAAKNLDLSAPELAGFSLAEEVPAPVLHQYTGAYLAEHLFGVQNEDVLNAVRYHTSGRPNMSMLEKVVFLSDMLEEGRDFPGIGKLRKLFYEDIDECMFFSLKRELKHLKKSRQNIYPLTERAFEYYQENRS